MCRSAACPYLCLFFYGLAHLLSYFCNLQGRAVSILRKLDLYSDSHTAVTLSCTHWVDFPVTVTECPAASSGKEGGLLGSCLS